MQLKLIELIRRYRHFGSFRLMRCPGFSVSRPSLPLSAPCTFGFIYFFLSCRAGYPIIQQRSFFFFARRSCSEQSTFHGQASDRVWFFPNCSFKASRRKKKKRKVRKVFPSFTTRISQVPTQVISPFRIEGLTW